MDWARLDCRLEASMELVVEGPRSLHRRDVLGDSRKVDRSPVRHLEGMRKVLGEIPRSGDADHGDDATRGDRLHDLRVHVLRARLGGGCEPALLAEDRAVESFQLLARLDPEVVDERRPGRLVRVERLCLTAGAIQREHEQSAKRLAERMLCDDSLELGDHLGVATGFDVGLDPLLDRDDPELFEPADLSLGERLEHEVCEWRPPPEGEGLPE